MKDKQGDVVKGFIIGASMSVPGVSGGTMAILLGIYDKLIHAVSHFLKTRKRKFVFLNESLYWSRTWNWFISKGDFLDAG